MSEPYQAIDCGLHDYLELACLRRYRLRIEWRDGEPLEARALITETTASREEYLLVEGPDGEPHRLRLDRLLTITPLDADAEFGRIVLAPD